MADRRNECHFLYLDDVLSAGPAGGNGEPGESGTTRDAGGAATSGGERPATANTEGDAADPTSEGDSVEGGGAR